MKLDTPSGRPPTTDETGAVALMLVIAIVTILSLTVAIVVQLGAQTLTTAAVRRVQAQALNAAEAGLNLSYEAIQSATSVSSLPCSTTGSFATTPTASSYSTTIDYYDTFPPSDAHLTCTSGSGPSATPLAAEIGATGTDKNGTGYMEALVQLTVASSGAGVFDKAVFSQATFNMTQSATVYGNSGDNANAYTNGSFACPNSSQFQGGLTVQGSFTTPGGSSCIIDGNLNIGGSISLNGSSIVTGNAYAAGGGITMTQSAIVQGSAYATGSISLSNSAAVDGTQHPNSAVTAPTSETYPTLNFSSSAWTAAGYTSQITDNNCGTTGNNTSGSNAGGVYTDIQNMMSAAAPTVIITSCPIYLPLQSENKIPLNQNLAIFSTGGFTMSQSTEWCVGTSSNNCNNAGPTHQLYIVVPSSAGTMPCASPGISLNNSTQFDSTLDTLLMTPCTLTINSSGNFYGQLYGGTVTQDQSFKDYFEAVGSPAGASGGGGTGSTITESVIYERQDTSTPTFQ